MVDTGKSKEPTIEPVLPPELMSFLSRKSYSLLIKGEAATGKTILALSVLKHVVGADSYLYLSTRVSPEQLFENHPWLAELGKKHSEEEEHEGKVSERFVDSRLDEPVPFFERMTNELMDVRSPIIVVDSWDPIAAMMDEEALISNVKVLQTWRERAEAKIVTLIEDSSNVTYDSLFDGVVTLDKYYEDGRIVRMAQLSKLSGVKINRPSHLFTLEGGVFRSFSTYNPMSVDPKKSVGWMWEKRVKTTGYPELDAILDGSLPHGTITELKLGNGVNSKLLLLTLAGILGAEPKRTKTVLYKPFQGMTMDQVTGAIGEVATIQQPKGAREGISDALQGQVVKIKSRRTKIVALFGSSFLSEARDEDDRERLLELMKSEIDATVIVDTEEIPADSTSRVADISLKLSDVNGTPLLQAQLPWTEYFAITSKSGKGPSTLSLVPMV